MNTDVELRQGNDLTILDCKYYVEAFSERHNTERFKTHNLYQLYAYIKNRAILEPTTNVSGILLYPEVAKPFHHRFTLQGHSITIASINLNQPWREIARELKDLVAQRQSHENPRI